jgi:hypothetical protein
VRWVRFRLVDFVEVFVNYIFTMPWASGPIDEYRHHLSHLVSLRGKYTNPSLR